MIFVADQRDHNSYFKVMFFGGGLRWELLKRLT